jgi:hypothetical protein
VFTSLSAIFAGLLMPAQQDVLIISTKREIEIAPRYSRTDYGSVCGSTVFRVRFRNGPDERGLVEHVLINGRSVPGAAEMLDIRAARRWIESIEIMNCGMHPARPEFRGVMKLSKAESQIASMRPMLFFRITRQGGEGWRLTMDD